MSLEKLEQLDKGIRVYERADTFGEWILYCIDSAANLGLTTIETYHQHARLYILSQPIAKIHLADLGIPDLRDWLGGVSKIKSTGTKRRLSANTIHRAYERIRAALLIAFEDRRIDWLPPKTLKLPPIEEVERRALTIGECNLLRDEPTASADAQNPDCDRTTRERVNRSDLEHD